MNIINNNILIAIVQEFQPTDLKIAEKKSNDTDFGIKHQKSKKKIIMLCFMLL